ncbi:MAG: hypothetical protein ACRDZ5_09005 [Acidimicrobiales bacterium]
MDETTARPVSHHLEICRRSGLEAASYTEIQQALQPASESLARYGSGTRDRAAS